MRLLASASLDRSVVELEWTRAAIGDLDEALEYIVADDQLSAAHMADRVLEAAEYLLEYPNLRRIGRVRGTRQLVVSGTPFVIV